MSLFQRITTPFGEPGENAADRRTMHNAAGEVLRERRQQLRLDLDAVAEALCIKPVYLAAIEQGRTEELPGPTYTIGFIRAYATYLGLDGERVLEIYREEKTDVQTRPDLTFPVPLGERGVPGGRVLLAGVLLALCGYGGWYYLNTDGSARPERVAPVPAELQQLTAPASSVQAAASAAVQSGPVQVAPGTPMVSPAPPTAVAAPQLSSGLLAFQSGPVQVAPGAPMVNPAPPAAVAAPQLSSGLLALKQSAAASAAPDSAPPVAAPGGGAVEPVVPGAAAATDRATGPAGSRPEAVAASPSASPSGGIDIRALADSWIQIRDGDQAIVFARVLKAGETYRVPRPGLMMRTGNAGALEVLVDGKPAPSLGALGTLRRNVTLEPDALLAGKAVRG